MCSLAYVTLVMKSDKYVAGALVLAQSLRNSGTKCTLICMITNDISVKSIKVLKKFYDFVKTVPYITHKCISLKNYRQRVLYEKWIESSFTKWNCLNPLIYDQMFDKVMFIDADMLVIENCDEQLFSLKPPALTFSSPWAKPYSRQGVENPYGELKHGIDLSCEEVDHGFKSFVGCGSLVLLKPDQRVYNQMIKLLYQKNTFGFSQCFSGFDEQLICKTFCSLKESFRHIHQMYNWSAGKWQWLSIAKINEPNLTPKVIHYYGDQKPWFSSRNNQWNDTNLWWDIADHIISKDDSTRKYFEFIAK